MNRKISTRAWYNRHANEWTALHRGRQYWKREHRRFHALLPRGWVLDLGCGWGRDALFFLRSGYHYLGIDNSEKMIAIARKRNPRGTFRVFDMVALSRLRRRFDGFWAVASLLHIPRTRVAAVLRGLEQVPRPGGVGMIAVKKGTGEEYFVSPLDTNDHRLTVFFSRREFLELLKRAGFLVITSYEHKTMRPDPVTWLVFFVRREG